MSTQTAPRPRQHRHAAAAGDGHDEIAAFFARVAESGTQRRLRGVTGTCRFDIAGAGTWRVSLNDGAATVEKDPPAAGPDTCVVSADAEDFRCLLRQKDHLNLYAAFAQERATVTGDLPFAYTVLGSFMLVPSVRAK